MKILVTGAAGFIGAHLALRLARDGHEVIGVDNLNAYYPPALKEARIAELGFPANFRFVKLDLANRGALAVLFAEEKFDRVVHLAAQAGVRYSIENPHIYAESNLIAFLNLLEGCRHHSIGHFVYASSSTVYGLNESFPFRVGDPVDHPISLYAATKKANELMAHTYSHLYRLPTTGLRFFNVYGPWGRPDMATWLFTRSILKGEPIKVFNNGKMERDFTYIDDVVEGCVRVLAKTAEPDPTWDPAHPNAATSNAPYRLYNIGNNRPIPLLDFIAEVEKATGKKAKLNLLPMQPGDVEKTAADVDALREAVGFAPSTPLAEGVAKFVAWYKERGQALDV